MVAQVPKTIDPLTAGPWKTHKLWRYLCVMPILLLCVNYVLGYLNGPLLNYIISLRSDSQVVEQIFDQTPWRKSNTLWIGHEDGPNPLTKGSKMKTITYDAYTGMALWELSRAKFLFNVRPKTVFIEYNAEMFEAGQAHTSLPQDFSLWDNRPKFSKGIFDLDRSRSFFNLLNEFSFKEAEPKRRSFSPQHLRQMKIQFNALSRFSDVYWVTPEPLSETVDWGIPGEIISFEHAKTLVANGNKQK